MRLRPLAKARSFVKTWGAEALVASGAGRVLGGRPADFLVLCYHRVVPDEADGVANADADADAEAVSWLESCTAPAMSVRVSTLEKQLDWIGERYRFVDLDELTSRLEAGGGSARGSTRGGGRETPLAAVTFDDGYADVFANAAPLLARKGIPWAAFVVTDLVGTSRLQVHDELQVLLSRIAARSGRRHLLKVLWRGLPSLANAWSLLRSDSSTELTESLLQNSSRKEIELLLDVLRAESEVPPSLRRRLAPMSWAMVEELRSSGVLIGSHTRSHRVLLNEAPKTVLAELNASRRLLEARLGDPVRHLSYPCGAFDPLTVEAARAAGYEFAYTTCGHRVAGGELLTIPRRTFWEKTGVDARGELSDDVLSCLIDGVFDFFNPCAPGHHEPVVDALPEVERTGTRVLRPRSAMTSSPLESHCLQGHSAVRSDSRPLNP